MSEFSNAASRQLSFQPASRFEAPSPSDNPKNRHTFIPQSWTSQALSTLQATVLIVVGCFLWSKITDAPELVVDVALLGAILIAGGFGMLSSISPWKA